MTTTTTGLPDRYRPISQVAPDEETPTGVIRSWRARDRVLNRDVALRVHTPGGPPAREWITRALTAGGLATPALSMVYDAAEGTGTDGSGGAAYVVNEWLEGTTLRDHLAAHGPLPERDARALVRRLAEGVAEAHRVGLAVGGLTPEHVVLRPGGLAGLLSVPAATGTVQGDIAALGALLELALTGSPGTGDAATLTSPDLAALVRRARSTDPATQLSSAATMVALLAERPRTGPQSPTVRVEARGEGLSDTGWVRRLRDRRDLADAAEHEGPENDRAQQPIWVDRRSLPPVPATSAVRPGAEGRWPVQEDEDDLDWSSAFVADDADDADDVGLEQHQDHGPATRRRLALVGLPLLALLLVVAFALWFGKNVLSVAGSVEDTSGSTPTVSTPAAGTSAGATTPSGQPVPAPAGALPVTATSIYDPFGDGEPENDSAVPRTVDGNPATGWTTVAYRGSADFGSLKPGVGVLYDLGAPKPLAGVTLVTSLPGTAVQVRTGNDPGADLDAFPVAAGLDLTGTDDVAFPAPVTARYVLVWVTRLVPVEDGFAGGLAEVTPRAAG